ncbi:MAG: oxygen-dependent coproporphyrinogen oxidase [Ignavibacteriaceae bacterium]
MAYSDRFTDMENIILGLQNKICGEFEKIDTKNFIEDKWKRDEGGGGITKVISNGNTFEKGGINFSSVYGILPNSIARQVKTEKGEFAVCGLSIIIHPYSPMIPTIHMNIRYFEMANGKSWFGGGIDLTPYYPFEDDFKYFHSIMKNACNSVIDNSYPEFKEYCDEYFTVKHRNEMRGIGGIFFDYLPGDDKHFELAKSVGNSFLEAYLPIVEKRKNEKYSAPDKEFQLIRRGRYVEFNLIYDRGTLFGLKTGGRIESILISMPPEVKFIYNYNPPENSPQEKMMKYYQPLKWV